MQLWLVDQARQGGWLTSWSTSWLTKDGSDLRAQKTHWGSFLIQIDITQSFFPSIGTEDLDGHSNVGGTQLPVVCSWALNQIYLLKKAASCREMSCGPT